MWHLKHSTIVYQGNDMPQLGPFTVFDAMLALEGLFILTPTWMPAQGQEDQQGFVHELSTRTVCSQMRGASPTW